MTVCIELFSTAVQGAPLYSRFSSVASEAMSLSRSPTRLFHIIAQKISLTTHALHMDLVTMVDVVSALGFPPRWLRHTHGPFLCLFALKCSRLQFRLPHGWTLLKKKNSLVPSLRDQPSSCKQLTNILPQENWRTRSRPFRFVSGVNWMW